MKKVLLAICLPGIFAALLVRAEIPKSITDATGTELVLSRTPERIVSLNPDFTENVIALGEGGRLAGVTDFCSLPDDCEKIIRVGNLYQPNLEKIASLRPDLVLVTMEGNRMETVRALRNLGISVYVTEATRSLEGYFKLLLRLGAILNCPEKARVLVDEFRRRISGIESSIRGVPKVPVFFQIGVRPIISVSGETIIDELIEVAGGKNIAAGAPLRYPRFSREEVLAKNPGVIIIAAMGEEADLGHRDWKRFPALRAVRNGSIFTLDPDLVCRLGPSLELGLTRIAAFLHPEIWKPENQN